MTLRHPRRAGAPFDAECDTEPGFALPVVLTLLLLVSLLAAAGHALSTLELRISDAHRLSVDAFYRADGALRELVGTLEGSPEPLRSVPIPGGNVQLSTLRLLILPGGESLVRVLSRSTLSAPGGGDVRRGVGSVVLAPGELRLPAALTTLATLEAAGGSARLDGFAEAGPSGCPEPGSVAGVAVVGEAPPALPPDVSARGEPPILTFAHAVELGRAAALEWRALLTAFGPGAVARVPDDPWPASSGVAVGEEPWPVVRIQGPYRLTAAHRGRGAILSDGDLELADGFVWDGLILTDAGLSITGRVRVRGGVAAGLGALLGRPPGSATLAADGLDVRWDSCHAAAAAAALRPPATVVRGTWFEEMEAWF